MFGRISFGRSSGGSSSSNSGGSGVSAGGGREITIRCGRGSYETRNHYWSEKAQACVDIYASSASKYPSGTGSSGREGRGDGGSGSYLSGTGGIGSGGSGSTFRTTQESSKPMIKYISLALGAPQKSLDSICKIQVNGTEYHAIDYGAKSRLGIMKYGTISYSNLLLENTLGKISWRPDFHKIKFISLKGCSLLDADLLYFNDNLVNRGYLPNLLELDLSENYNLSSAGILHLLKTPKCIINLNLGSNNIDQYGLIYIASALTQGTLPSLNSLNLSSNTITDGGLAYLLENAVVPSLKTLDLSGNQITNLGLAYFYRLNSFKTAKYLVNLNLSGNNIDDWGAKYIEEGFMHNKLPHLNSLTLANNNITDTGAKYLADSLQKGEMSKLKTLHLEGNKLSPAGESYLAVAVNKAPNDTLGVIVEKHTSSAGVWNFIKKAFNYYAQEHYKKAQANDKAALAIYGQDDWAHCKKLVADASQEMSTGFVKYSSYMLAKQALQKGSLPVKTCAVGGVFIFSAGEAALNVNVENLVYCLTAINKEIENIIKPNGDISYFSPELIGNNGEVDDGF